MTYPEMQSVALSSTPSSFSFSFSFSIVMTVPRPSVSLLHYTFGTRDKCVRLNQRRWAQVHDVRFLATHHQSDRVFEKYKEKLQRKVKEYAEAGDRQ